MKRADLVIVGGSAAGFQAAISARKHKQVKEVVLIRKERRAVVPCGIPYIVGTLGSVEKNLLPDALLGDTELIVDEVTSINRDARTLDTAGGESIGYDRLVLATGSQPLVPKIPGAELQNVFAVWKDAEYLEKLHRALEQAHDVVIVGGGFIGAEFADECRKLNCSVTIVELLTHCLFVNCDEDFCMRIEEKLRNVGVQIRTGCRVQSIEGKEKVEHVLCDRGERIRADVVILAVGVKPNVALAEGAGLPIGEQGGIEVDQYMMTTDPHIFAIGDCAEKYSFFTGKSIALRLASTAAREARIAMANLAHPRRQRNLGTVGVFSTMIAGTAVGVVGLTERAAIAQGFEVVIGESAAADKHPGTMPGAIELWVKLVFDKTTRKMLGGECCGGMSTGEISNCMAVLIAAEMTVDQVATLRVGTHPALTASPLVYQLVNAAEDALTKFG